MPRGIRYALTPLSRCCPACKATGARLLYRVDSREAAQHWVLRERDPARNETLRTHIEALWGGDSCLVVRCDACGMCYADPFVAGDHRFFDLAFEHPGYPADRWEFGLTRETLLARLGRPGLRRAQVLDVGSGTGASVKALVPALVPAGNVLCTEYARDALDALRGLGVTALDADVRDLVGDHRGRFDVICLFQVLVHFDRIDALFDALGRMAKPDAHAFISLPNDARSTFQELNGGLLDMPPGFTGRWTRAAFEALAARHGWTLEAHAVEPEPKAARALNWVIYVYARERQRPGSPENRIERLRPGPPRTALRALGVASQAVRSLPSLAALLCARHLGATQWVYLRRGSGVPDGR